MNPFPHIRRFLAQPRLVLAWVLNFGRETWWVAFFVYTPIKMKEMLGGGISIGSVVLPSLYRDGAGLAPMALFSLLLTFFDLSAVYAAVAIGWFICAWLAHWLPRSM